jgi:hypothetical protein
MWGISDVRVRRSYGCSSGGCSPGGLGSWGGLRFCDGHGDGHGGDGGDGGQTEARRLKRLSRNAGWRDGTSVGDAGSWELGGRALG